MKRFLSFALALAVVPGSPAATKANDTTPHWSYQPVVRPALPAAKNSAWVRSDLDRFILAKLEAKGLQPSPEADPRTLIRRLYFDLLGLPPSPEAVEAFVTECRSGSSFVMRHASLEKLVDKLLASPHYGERWARHWLDIAHYADTHGFERDQLRPNAWRYRDYVIAALNADKPYDQFLREQIAGDVLADASQLSTLNSQLRVATGFLAAGPWDFVGQIETKSDVLKRAARADDLDDMVTQVLTASMGVTINCARCHDHKLDPISQREYYGLWAVFAGVKRGDRELDPAATARRANADPEKVYAITNTEPAIVKVLRRGNPEDAQEDVAPGVLACVRHAPADFTRAKTEGERRLALAEWITHPANPLTRRVLVNRLWHHHFGVGLVDTPSDFGKGGGVPSHPELLDWLAEEFLARDWSLKAMHRLICTSSAYRQCSVFSVQYSVASGSSTEVARSTGSPLNTEHWKLNASLGQRLDASNRLLWRQNPRRLDAESTRDAVLAVSGKLNPAAGGPGFRDFKYTEAYAPIYNYVTADTPELWRRSIYRFVVRTTPHTFMTTLDCPNPANLTPARTATTTALQALALSNNEFMLQQARHLAARLERDAGPDPPAQITRAFQLAFARPPSRAELAAANELARTESLFVLCRMLLNANEFVYVD